MDRENILMGLRSRALHLLVKRGDMVLLRQAFPLPLRDEKWAYTWR
ncbi:MAG: hypothetical protein BWY63_03696 [Chloroflexi bacterium ADurb.Bin360]|nr:MAG: hypothetical protein BWY63_03696 [Chloroflexi bacterium ADurb.Bin360]